MYAREHFQYHYHFSVFRSRCAGSSQTPCESSQDRYAPIKTVQAVVIDKNKVETFSKYSGNGKSEKYVIVFSVEGKKKSFYVSQFSYNGYRVNEKGTLKYKGDKLIEFK